MTDSDIEILRCVEQNGTAFTGHRTDVGEIEVYGRGAHRLVNAGFLRVVRSYQSMVEVELTTKGRNALASLVRSGDVSGAGES